MSVNFNVVARKNPQNPEAPPMYYATFNSKGSRNLRYVAQYIADKSSLNVIDIKAVLEGFIQVIPELLSDGYIVSLEEFGNFHLTCSSAASSNAADVSVKNIEKVNLRFLPSKLFKKALDNISFNREMVD